VGTAQVANGDTDPAGDPANAGLSRLARYARPAIVGLLLIAVLAGVRAASVAAVQTSGPWNDRVLQVALLLEVALAVLLIAVAVIRRRQPNPGHPAADLRAALPRAIIAAMIAAAALAGLDKVRPHAAKTVTPPAQGARPPRAGHTATPRTGNGAAISGADLTYVVYGILALLLLAAIAACVIAILRRSQKEPAGYLAGTDEDDDDDVSLEHAVESGRIALRALDDARAAIIACYVAMEASLGEAGAARTAAETPDELLARAVTSGLLRGTAAARLTALFYEARFSSHSLPATARDDASQALDEISAELSRPARGGQAPGASAAGAEP
jgi:hypothetical protein